MVEKLIAQVVRLSIIIRNLAAFYNYNFEIGDRTANGRRQKAEGGTLGSRVQGAGEGEGRKAEGQRPKREGERK